MGQTLRLLGVEVSLLLGPDATFFLKEKCSCHLDRTLHFLGWEVSCYLGQTQHLLRCIMSLN